MNDAPLPHVDEDLLAWLLEGDVSIQYQARRDLLGQERPDLRARIAAEGWGAEFLRRRQPEGHWGQRFYQPKWTSTHYTLLDLKHLAIAPDQPEIRASIAQVLETLKGPDGGVLPVGAQRKSDVCVNGMFLNYAAYFGAPERDLRSIVDFLLAERMPDGGFNCESNYRGAAHSSVHSTVSVAEGLLEYERAGYAYRLPELRAAEAACREFLLRHRLFRSHRTGEVIDRRFLMLSYPSRWRYDVLRALEHFRAAGAAYDERLEDALAAVWKKRRADGTWTVQARHPGQTHFEMETTGGPSRWNTLRALRVLRHFGAQG